MRKRSRRRSDCPPPSRRRTVWGVLGMHFDRTRLQRPANAGGPVSGTRRDGLAAAVVGSGLACSRRRASSSAAFFCSASNFATAAAESPISRCRWAASRNPVAGKPRAVCQAATISRERGPSTPSVPRVSKPCAVSATWIRWRSTGPRCSAASAASAALRSRARRLGLGFPGIRLGVARVILCDRLRARSVFSSSGRRPRSARPRHRESARTILASPRTSAPAIAPSSRIASCAGQSFGMGDEVEERDGARSRDHTRRPSLKATGELVRFPDALADFGDGIDEGAASESVCGRQMCSRRSNTPRICSSGGWSEIVSGTSRRDR